MKTKTPLILLWVLLINTVLAINSENKDSALRSDLHYHHEIFPDCIKEPSEQDNLSNLYQSTAFEIVINEIMADPDPVVGLPNSEYIELFNRSSNSVIMNNWLIYYSSSIKQLPYCILEPGEYCLIVPEGKEALFKSFGKVIPVPGLTLLNSGTTITLKNHVDAVIHSVTYSDNWYNDNSKSSGGWSLEQVDPGNPCSLSGNWKATTNLSGGTPGKVNSVNAINTDVRSPEISFTGIASKSSIVVSFNEPMDSITLVTPSSYSVDNGFGSPRRVTLHPPYYDKVTLEFSSSFIEDTKYNLQFTNQLKDCLCNPIVSGSSTTFSLPKVPKSLDIVLNELLYEPLDNACEFIELYNTSFNFFDLHDIWIGLRDGRTNEIKNLSRVSKDSRLMYPGQYIVLSKDSHFFTLNTDNNNHGNFVTIDNLPTLNNSGGTLVLLDTSNTIIDEFTYSPELHFPLLNSTKGVSLERINPLGNTNESSNWHSASSSAGFSTPGYQNSQFMQLKDSKEIISIEPLTFSPDNDGYNDQLSIKCSPVEYGSLITIKVYDCNGQQVKLITANDLSGTSNLYSWDGTTDEKQRAPVGIYIIYTEIFNLDKKSRHYKNIAILSVRI